MGDLVMVFLHTSQGAKALAELVAAGVSAGDVRVIGDVGTPAGEGGAHQHVTLDALHVPVAERELVMDVVRGGGVVVAVPVGTDVSGSVRIGEGCGALKVFETGEGLGNPSHNVAGSAG